MSARSAGARVNKAESTVRTAARACGVPSGQGLRSPLAYDAFCRDHWPVYLTYATVASGCPRVGADAARSALRDLAFRWDTALSAAAPAAVAWVLLSDKSVAHHTPSVRRLRRVLGPREVDALLLRHRVGLSAPAAAHAMGLDGPGFELLRARALRGITQRTLW
ncbi:hypothetical protein LCE32_18635 [Streptomyces sp. 7G]|uniref:hypothetical protein n=1 Tax=Streptomyces sp. 7G TaxID=2877241 RepID=UPI001CD3AEB6|nr:hypothetical protein [Streptomyces sp. 7G]MCA1272053.1 hypothetical protein [Streptomyces sp. 7G]